MAANKSIIGAAKGVPDVGLLVVVGHGRIDQTTGSPNLLDHLHGRDQRRVRRAGELSVDGFANGLAVGAVRIVDVFLQCCLAQLEVELWPSCSNSFGVPLRVRAEPLGGWQRNACAAECFDHVFLGVHHRESTANAHVIERRD